MFPAGESSRSIYEMAKEHQTDRNKNSEESHQIKHWLTSHEEQLAPPKLQFRIVRSFQDPLTRQLSEAVRKELRGEEILNSKAEYSRCRVPRLRVDMEGWQPKQKEKEKEGRNEPHVPEGSTGDSSQQEAEETLAEQAGRERISKEENGRFST